MVNLILGILAAQQPAYFVMGENQLKGLKIFDIQQDLNRNYYFATNEGIIKYDFIQYSKVEVKSAKSMSFFNLCINPQGAIYFNNLNNQIFEIKNGQCRLFYELTGTQSSNLICLANDANNNLLIGCKGLLVLDSNAKVLDRKYTQSPMSYSYKADANTWVFSGARDTVLVWEGKGIRDQIIQYDNSKNKLGFFTFFDYLDSSYVLDISSKYLYAFDKKNWRLKDIGNKTFFQSNTNTRVYVTGKQIWSPSSVLGVNFSENGYSSAFNTYYNDVFVSDIYLDAEGNILLGTFDKGVIVIPDLKIDDVVNSATKDPMISLYADANNAVYMGSNTGVLYEYKNNNLTTLTGNQKKSIEGVFGASFSDYIIYGDRMVGCLNKKTGEVQAIYSASLKDVAFISPTEMCVGTNVGISRVRILPSGKVLLEQIPNQNLRIYSLAFNSQTRLLYSSGANGLEAIDSLGNSVKIEYQGRGLFPEHILYFNGYIYAADREWGILSIDKHNSIRIIKPKLPYKEESIKKMALYKNTFIVSTSNGLYQLDGRGAVLEQFHTSFRFSAKKVYDFSVQGDVLWVSHLGGVQKIELQYKKPITRPEIFLRMMRVNDQVIDWKTSKTFGVKDRKFEFVIYSPTLKYQENIKYQYKLLGYNDKWQVLLSSTNTITYAALPPGNYTLLLRAEVLGNYSKELQYSFTILSPIYTKWWFVLGCMLLFLVVVVLIYRRQLNAQREKSRQINELNLSKLTAIQSQMNPHFIFNSLNSIQDLVLQQNATKAYDSINKFAALIRKIMHHSSSEFIDIEEELSILNIYLELELLRFKKDFSYEIRSNNIADIEIPPMLIQPYVENALKHGLLHKAGEKRLEIEMKLENGIFSCVVTDNGIGRKKSQEMKDRQNKLYDSFSGSSLNTRMEILKKHFGGEIGIEIVDLYDESGVAMGTQVVLKAPYRPKY